MENSKAKEVWLTRHMFGEKLEKIADCGSFDEAMTAIFNWKETHYGKEKGTAVDFGDYSYFMLITSGEDAPEVS